VNVNDDSFSGDGSLDAQEIVIQCREKICAGADIIDLGAESARTNREAISEEEEVARLIPVLKCWENIVKETSPRGEDQVFPPVLSINTWRPSVIKALLDSEYGKFIGLINDMSALAYLETLEVIKRTQVSLLIMHSVGLPKQDHSYQRWDNISESLRDFFKEKISLVLDAGIPLERVVIDPGLDFAKTSENSFQALREIEMLNEFDCPVLVPLSRKQFIGDAINEPEPGGRDAGTVACLPFILPLRAAIVRVHNVDANWQGVKVLSKL